MMGSTGGDGEKERKRVTDVITITELMAGVVNYMLRRSSDPVGSPEGISLPSVPIRNLNSVAARERVDALPPPPLLPMLCAVIAISCATTMST